MTLALSEFWKGYWTGGLVVAFGGPLLGRPVLEFLLSWRVKIERRERRRVRV